MKRNFNMNLKASLLTLTVISSTLLVSATAFASLQDNQPTKVEILDVATKGASVKCKQALSILAESQLTVTRNGKKLTLSDKTDGIKFGKVSKKNDKGRRSVRVTINNNNQQLFFTKISEGHATLELGGCKANVLIG
jgi:hypothetical protein